MGSGKDNLRFGMGLPPNPAKEGVAVGAMWAAKWKKLVNSGKNSD
jgi:hypothetical protein